MFITNIGPFDGDSWENLCQQVFKQEYGPDGYQQIPASPGDFGLEGVTLGTGWGFQCYCPDTNYNPKALYEAQRDKITADVAKLKLYEKEIASRIGKAKIKKWILVTPRYSHHDLLKHARRKEKEVRSWGLSILDPDFEILVHDADHYLVQIAQIRSANGEAIEFESDIPTLAPLTQGSDEYEKNVLRKSKARLTSKESSAAYPDLVARLHSSTLESFLQSDALFRRIEQNSPPIYFRLLRLINEFELDVIETCATWMGTAEELTAHVKSKLCGRILADLSPEIDETTATRIARHMTARWIAICQLDYE